MQDAHTEVCRVCGQAFGRDESVAFFHHTGEYVHPGCVYTKATRAGIRPWLSTWLPMPLRCEECSCVGKRARGWMAQIVEDETGCAGDLCRLLLPGLRRARVRMGLNVCDARRVSVSQPVAVSGCCQAQVVGRGQPPSEQPQRRFVTMDLPRSTLRLTIDGVQQGPGVVPAIGANERGAHAFNWQPPLSAGSHTASIQWRTDLGGTLCADARSMIIFFHN
jgi:hypothetical protein